MQNIEFAIFLAIFAALAALVVAGIIKYFTKLKGDIRYMQMEIDRAESWDEYVYWKRKLRIVKWCVIPGLTPKRIKKVTNIFEPREDKEDDGIMSMVMPSIVAMVCCSLCLAGSTFAWFTSSSSTGTSVIQSATFNLDITVIDKSDSQTVTPIGGEYVLKSGRTYDIILKAEGTATTGFASIKINGDGAETFVTEQLSPTEGSANKAAVSFDLTVSESDIVIKIMPYIGSAAKQTDDIVSGESYQATANGIEKLEQSAENGESSNNTENNNDADNTEISDNTEIGDNGDNSGNT